MAEPIQILDYFTWVNGTSGNFFLPWFRWPAEYRNAELWIDAKTHDGSSSLHFNVWSSMDMDDRVSVVQVEIPNVGLAINSISSKLGQFIRVELESSIVVSKVVLSAWLIPKFD